jgi:hypothetical protein
MEIEMTQGDMIADFNTTPPPGMGEVYMWLRVVFLAFCALELFWWMFGGYIVLTFATKENLVRRAHNAEDEVIRLESKVKACEIRITYLEGENETLRALAVRSGSRVVDRDEPDRLRPKYTPEERAEMWGMDGDNDYSIEL